MALCFVPVSPEQLTTWATEGVLTGRTPAHTVTPAMVEAFSLTDPAGEDAEYAALLVASVAGLLQHGARLVAVCEARPADSGRDADFGAVVVSDVPWPAVTALFADEPGAPAAAAAVAVSGLSLAEAWEHPAVTALLADSDLLWYGPGEWASLARG